MKRLILGFIGLYLFAALVGRVNETLGRTRCECDETCWCRRPFLGTFRWVFPFGHRGEADGKAAGNTPG